MLYFRNLTGDAGSEKDYCRYSVLEKVTTFVTHSSPGGTELLLFEHPSAGIQLPAGTVEGDEPHADAAAREAREDTGLVDLPAGRFLKAVTEMLPDKLYAVATTTRVYSRPDTTSFDWASIRRGMLVLCKCLGPDFCNITYLKHDKQAQPPYVTYQITGWVPIVNLTR